MDTLSITAHRGAKTNPLYPPEKSTKIQNFAAHPAQLPATHGYCCVELGEKSGNCRARGVPPLSPANVFFLPPFIRFVPPSLCADKQSCQFHLRPVVPKMSFFHPIATSTLPIRQDTRTPSANPRYTEQPTQPMSPYSLYSSFSQSGGLGSVDLNSITQDDEVVYDSQLHSSNDGMHCETNPPTTNQGMPTQDIHSLHRPASKRSTKRGLPEDTSTSKLPSSRFHWDSRSTTVLIEMKRTHELDRFHAGIGGRSKTLEEQCCEVVTAMAGRGVLVDWKAAYDKWKRLVTIHKEISDWERNTPSGKNSYWLMTARERKEEGKFGNLNFDKDIFDFMERFYGHDPLVNPPVSTVDTSNNIRTPSATSGPDVVVDDAFEQTTNNGGIAKKTRKRIHVYDVGLKEATRDIAEALEAAEDAKSDRHKAMLEIERTKVEIGLRSAMGIEGLSNALNRIADKM